MNRDDVERQYRVEGGYIVSPGKFEAEPVWVPAFWEHALEGFASDDDGETYTFVLDEQDRAQWPELQGADKVQLTEDENGFVYGTTLPMKQTAEGGE